MADAVEGLDALRGRVTARQISWDHAVDAYTAVVEPTFDVQSTLTALQAGQLAREAQVVVELVRVREFVSREDALVAGARAAGSLTDRQYDTLTATVEDRRVFHRTYVPDLPGDSRALFEEFEQGDEYRALTAGEDAVLRAGASGAGKAMAAESWRTTTDRAVKRYMLLFTQSALNTAERGRTFAYREMIKAAVVGGLGLLAVGLSVWFSMASGRRISRRLEELRDAADVLATRQLPEVMERLGAGEEVDAAEAAPPLDFGDEDRGPDEIGQVGRALNAARLAAVEVAVKQATLRRGVFAVLLNIARRNQALVHRQAKLVDTLERRTADPDTLEDLFRIDHLTTRMRRHAEGLIILSGASPGRRWRGPVPVVDVVGAAVGEIEDYTRVVLPPMPAVGIRAEAVADVVHLVAELVENAAVFSPPHTQVTMRTGSARNGFVLEIDDRGLGMDAEELAQAHRTLARPGDFDPAQDERLGLYVVGRLAERHGIGVTLCRSPYGGTTAVVLLPHTILAPVDPDPGTGPEAPAEELSAPPTPAPVRALPAPGGVAPPSARALPARSRQLAPVRPTHTHDPAGPAKGSADEVARSAAPAAQPAAGWSAEAPNARPADEPAARPAGAPRAGGPADVPRADGPADVPRAGRADGPAAGGAVPGLPTRVRQASLAAPLRAERPVPVPVPVEALPPARCRRRRCARSSAPSSAGWTEAGTATPSAGHPPARTTNGRTTMADEDSDLGWLLDDLLSRTDHVRQAVLLTADGLATSASEGMAREDVDHLSAVCAGFHSLAKEAGARFEAGSVRQTMVMLEDAYLFITPAGDGSRLAVLSDIETDVGQLAHEMSLLVRRVGRHMAVPTRSATEAPDT
ncbi:roadblock/LC7 domain-containing protein [Streptomyces sp. A3M-1-3]|uniref:nitrate- and nitrite sensing domain-containing protein n=1 Tax=Streptomyces sp. A3M-1-3 TaxID=2962044 RepID=UPI0020B76B85|nr:nitrate- and nitrite sensing domain-containing protein [Streptomyces sp. A3M-1-3]MCP3817014.1 roadblock/LC7 domain-containing protein [Streptomyces sp. A3M-1-3]